MSFGMGVAMTLDPRRSSDVLGWADRGGLTRLVGVVDLIPAAGLLLGRRRAPWMLVRANLDAALGLVYLRILADGHPRSRGAGAGAGIEAALTFFDHSLSRRLRGAEAT